MKKIIKLICVVILMTCIVSITSCIWGPTIAYDWQVESHHEFVGKIVQFNSTHDDSINSFISFDLDENEDVSGRIYHFDTIANKSAVQKYGLCDKTCSTFDIDIIYYFKSDTENSAYQDCVYQIGCYYRDASFNFSKQDKIEIKQCNTYNGEESANQCSHVYEDRKYLETLCSDPSIYNHVYHYEIFVNNIEVACIHISSINEESEEKLNEIIAMLYDSLVILNTGDKK